MNFDDTKRVMRVIMIFKNDTVKQENATQHYKIQKYSWSIWVTYTFPTKIIMDYFMLNIGTK